MNVISIAVTGASGLVGQRLLPMLADDPSVSRVVGLDMRPPRRRSRGLEFHLVDVARAELKPLLEGIDVLVHLASVVDPIPDETLMAHVNVNGTRRVLDAAAAVGVQRLVRVSSATVYGAWANNPVPLTEDSPLRPNTGFSPAVQAAEVERLLAEWRDDHPGVVVTTLRAAPVLGPGAERLPSRILLGRPSVRVRGARPPVQAVHIDDLVGALGMVVLADYPGTFNVASDGWLDHEEARRLLAPSRIPPLPAGLLERVLRVTWEIGVGDVPPGVVPYLTHPTVIANDRLRGIGWRPRHDNEEAVVDGLDSLGPPLSKVRWVALAAGAAAGAAATAWLLGRRWRRGARRATRPTPG
ncbi:MAG TPA: NAD-dependent epimerase/dehydratase family protein [Acidimicrobiia bacterium]|nr:NAD-dependent epimerase/dehydratase family protein [Acidimicrobiia bacterium]